MLKASNNMVEPAVISGAIPEHEVAEYMQLYKDVFTEFIHQKTHIKVVVFRG
jgi:hypothetical protein